MSSLRVLPLILLLAGCPKGGLEGPALPADPAEVAQTDPAQVLEEAAGSEDPTTRGRALALLVGTAPEPAGGRWLQRGLWDPSPWVQEEVVDALAERLGEPESVTAMAGFIQRDNADAYVRASAAAALAATGAAGGTVAWADERDPWLRTPLAFAAAVQGDADALEALRKAIAHDEVAMELHFLALLGHSDLDLKGALADGAEGVEPELGLVWAAARLAQGDDAGADLLRAAAADRDPFVQLEALDLLRDIDGTDAIVRRALGGPEDVDAYASLILRARGTGDADLLAILGSEVREAREQAMRLLPSLPAEKRRDKKEVRAALRLGLADEDATVRAWALRAAGEMGLGEEAPLVRAALGDDYPFVQVEAAGALLRKPPAQ